MEAIYKDYPEIIKSPIEMIEANSPIIIHDGEFVAVVENERIIIDGIIQFEWFPNSGTTFSGCPRIDLMDLFRLFKDVDSLEVEVEGLSFGKGIITGCGLSDKGFIKGFISPKAVKGDKSISVQKLRFAIPNLREFWGSVVKNVSGSGVHCSKGRLLLENHDYIITIDKSQEYRNLQDSLNSKGGYIIQYAGELQRKKGSILIDESRDILQCLSTFLSFLNGRRTSPLFIQGIYEDSIVWCDYSNYFIDSYKSVYSWPSDQKFDIMNNIWQKFNEYWQDQDDKSFLISAIHWYIEANSNSGFAEGSIIMAQTALELIYNWLLIENKKILIGKDSENINAANKIRLLLAHLSIGYNVPESFSNLQSYITDNKEIIDAPDAVVQIRNAIVHSQEEKRRKLSLIPIKVKYEALQLCIWYIEMSLLYILNYNSSYHNRCVKANHINETFQIVPWEKNKK